MEPKPAQVLARLTGWHYLSGDNAALRNAVFNSTNILKILVIAMLYLLLFKVE